ncbi:hypothetical protein DB790_12040 [Staphylococcus capitis]|uniref:TcaA second domain-containing protein n=1 Tax=Staphylococcus capitis TaxID=29388 RepID=UPI000F5CAAD2|nr:hypothetical protein [Staphylococcus capitis]RQX43699.1 hypothetical protein DB790_12040 [Staphylococcus capitis]
MEEEKDSNKSKRKIFVISVIAILVILLIAAIILFYRNNSSMSDINKFDNAVKDNDYKTVSYMLSDNETKISELEAKQFIQYVSKDENKSKYNKEIKEIKQSVKNKDNDTKKGSITDKNKKSIIDVTQDGKKFFILDKVDFKANKYNVYVEEYNNKAIYNYKLDEKIKTVAEPNQYTKLGSFFVGNYNLNATKTIKDTGNDGELNGNLSFNTDNKDKKNRIVANDNFNQSWFKANLSNAGELDKNTIKLYINDKEVDYKKGMIYGKLSNQSKVKVYAKGSVYNKTFKTNTILVDRNNERKPQEIQLKFNKKEVSKHVESYQNILDKSKEFINKYIKDLNKAYKKSDQIYIENYFDKDTDIYNQAKKDIKDKDNKHRKYSNENINNTNINKDDVVMEVNTNVNGKSIVIRYTLDLGYKNKYFRIKDIEQL